VTSVSGVPFLYVLRNGDIARDAASGLHVVRNGDPRQQQFVPGVVASLTRFLTLMSGVGMTVETILTGGSHY